MLHIARMLVGMLVVLVVSGCDDNGPKADAARRTVRKLAYEAYPMWAMRPGNSGRCPSPGELAGCMNTRTVADPWGQTYVIKCGGDLPAGATGVAVLSTGADRREGTSDDIKSWE